jgi:hypothetical protein
VLSYAHNPTHIDSYLPSPLPMVSVSIQDVESPTLSDESPHRYYCDHGSWTSMTNECFGYRLAREAVAKEKKLLLDLLAES